MSAANATILRFEPGLLFRLVILLTFVAMAIFAVGFEQNMVVHETFHDLRHAAGFPCH